MANRNRAHTNTLYDVDNGRKIHVTVNFIALDFCRKAAKITIFLILFLKMIISFSICSFASFSDSTCSFGQCFVMILNVMCIAADRLAELQFKCLEKTGVYWKAWIFLKLLLC